MDMGQNAWISGSLFFRFLEWMSSGSFLFSGVRRLSLIAGQSASGRWFSRFGSKPFLPADSLTGSLATRLAQALRPLRAAWSRLISGSCISAGIASSSLARLLLSLVIPFSTLYVFVDELGRKVFAGIPLFGYWDEALLAACFAWLLAEWLNGRGERLAATPLDAPLLLLAGVSFFQMLNVGLYPPIAVEGFRVVIQYTLFYFVGSRWLKDDNRAETLVRGLLITGGALAMHGFLQFLMKVPTPASWTDQAEAAVGTRVFSIVESPNILGSIMVLLLPLALAVLIRPGVKPAMRCVLAAVAGAMALCVLLTQSRGAWLGLAAAMVVFCLLVRPAWLFILAGGAFASLLLPPVFNRIAYLFTPQFVASSQRGGRMLRYAAGFRMFMEKPWTGVGLGHFGGAVAMNHKNLFPTTFYMDSYWLKTLVEMGIPGIAAFAVLMGLLLVWGVRAVRRAEAGKDTLMAAGAFAGLCGVMLHNFLENIFEVPYMVVYFWLLAALLMYWGFGKAAAGTRRSA
jgi:O-antigen ligase